MQNIYCKTFTAGLLEYAAGGPKKLHTEAVFGTSMQYVVHTAFHSRMPCETTLQYTRWFLILEIRGKL